MKELEEWRDRWGWTRTVTLYFRTDHAADIVAKGFQPSQNPLDSPWLSDRVLEPHERAKVREQLVEGVPGIDGEEVIAIDIPEAIFRKYAWDEDEADDDSDKGYTAAVIPAEVLNQYGSATLVHGE